MKHLSYILVAWSVLFSFYTHADNDTETHSELVVHKTCSLDAVWKDKGSGADLDGFFYLPDIEESAFIIGGYGTRTKRLSSSDCVLTVSESNYLVAPDDWELVWEDKGTGAKKKGSMWRAISPDDDHVCVGTIPQKGYEKPNLPDYRCVHTSFTEKMITDTLIWSDEGSGAEKEVTMFKLPNSGSFVAAEGRLAQLETYDLKLDSTLSATPDEVETAANVNTEGSGEKKSKKGIFGGLFKNKKLLGAVGGMVAGAIVADVFNASILDTIITIGLGAMIQGELADLLQSEADNRAIASYIDTHSYAASTTIRSEDGTKDLQLTINNSRTENRKVTMVRKKNMAPPPKLEMIGEKYRAKISSDVRHSPSTDSEIVGGFEEGEILNVVGKVIDNNWYLVGKDNIAMGYIHGELEGLITEEELEQDVVLRDLVALNSLGESDEAGVVNLDELTVADEVEANTSCKEMKLSDGQISGEVTVCKGSDGAWEIS